MAQPKQTLEISADLALHGSDQEIILHVTGAFDPGLRPLRSLLGLDPGDAPSFELEKIELYDAVKAEFLQFPISLLSSDMLDEIEERCVERCMEFEIA